LIDPDISKSDWEWEVDIEERETFDAFDQAYLNSMPTTVRQVLPLLIGRMVQIVNRAAGPILDIATGRGVLLRELALLLKVDQPLIGIDIDRKVLRGTQGYLRRRGLYDEVSLAVMDAKHLAFKPATMGLVTSWFGFNNMPEATAALTEVQRVLQPGGELAATVLNVDTLSNTHLIAEEAGFADLLTQEKVVASLEAAGLHFDRTETFIEGVWPGNPYDALPLKGDRFVYRLVIAQRT
jgi:ubiquinone/menaquinone biosynthesis C-methylase UbiE